MLTAGEENILRYAAGYVPFKLLKQFEKSPAADSGSIIECLSTMGEESSLLEYTTKWTGLINRGGLFDTTFMLFREMELMVRKHLFIVFERSTPMDCDQRETVVCAVEADESVQFYWTMLSK